jgi:hypothetical protein
MKRAFRYCAILTVSISSVLGQEISITSFDQNGSLTYTEVSTAQYYRVEWASAVTGAWHSDWTSLKEIPRTGAGTNSVHVPMFYRIIGLVPETNAASLFDGVTLNGWVQTPACEAWGVTTNGITFDGNPVGSYFRLDVNPKLTIGNSFLIQMDICGTNLTEVGFDMDRGNRFSIWNPKNTWHTLKLVVCVNDSEFQATPALPSGSTLGTGQVRRGGLVALWVWQAANNDRHLAYFRNIYFRNLSDAEAAAMITQMRGS